MIQGICKYRLSARVLAVFVSLLGANVARGGDQGAAVNLRLYVAPQQKGSGTGIATAAAADFRDQEFWSLVKRSIKNGSVVVTFLDGEYLVSSNEWNHMPALSLQELGHEQHVLTITGASENGVVFTQHPDDGMVKLGPGFLKITNSRNLVIRRLHFTARQPMTYATHFGGNRDLAIESCSWIDLPGVRYGATGTGRGTDHVTFRECVFKRVGSKRTAHMAYNAYGPQHVRFIDCLFEDCAGEYIRFRDGADFGVVTGCTFRSTGRYFNKNMPFISVPLFNDDNPAEQRPDANYEYFGTNFLITDNAFIYPPGDSGGLRVALLFHHSGFDPPGRNHLLTQRQARLLAEGAVAAKKALMLSNLGIDAAKVHYFNNKPVGVALSVAYQSKHAYGARSKGWSGIVEVNDVINTQIVAPTSERGLLFHE